MFLPIIFLFSNILFSIPSCLTSHAGHPAAGSSISSKLTFVTLSDFYNQSDNIPKKRHHGKISSIKPTTTQSTHLRYDESAAFSTAEESDSDDSFEESNYNDYEDDSEEYSYHNNNNNDNRRLSPGNSINDKILVENVRKKGKKCSRLDHERFKDKLLLLYDVDDDGVGHFRRENYNNNNERLEDERKSYLLSLMFSHFDQNNNGWLEKIELARIEGNLLTSTLPECSTLDLLRFDDLDRNGRLSLNEFYTAFNKLTSVSFVSLDKSLQLRKITAMIGDNVEIKCDIRRGSPPSAPVVWSRYGFNLEPLNDGEKLRIFSESDTLYLNKVQLHHAGNYTCYSRGSEKIIQYHILTVQTIPDVKMQPKISWQSPGKSSSIDCRVFGEPQPKIHWLKNEEPIPADDERYEINQTRLTIKNIQYPDTGAYYCKGVNQAGKSWGISSLVVVDQEPEPLKSGENSFSFITFHERGYTVYDPESCGVKNQIFGTDFIPGTQECICCGGNNFGVVVDADGIHNCEWGSAISVGNVYIYVSQPRLGRLLVISQSQMVVVDTIQTDQNPHKVHYVAHLDQLWVECWRLSTTTEEEMNEKPVKKTLQVIKNASVKRTHHTTVHLMEPFEGRRNFDTSVNSVFLPNVEKKSLNSQFRHGYVSHKNSRSLYKLDLITLTYSKFIDLTPYNCFPQQLLFSPLYGMIIIECFEPVTRRPKGQLILDYLTDSVISRDESMVGSPYLSPDGRKLITISYNNQEGTLLSLQHLSELGLHFAFDVKTSLNLSDISYFPAQFLQSYDVYATSVDKDNVLFLDLESGKVEIIHGIGFKSRSSSVQSSPWSSGIFSRPISTVHGPFAKFLVTPSLNYKSSIYVLNGLTRTVNCQISGHFKAPQHIIWF